MSHTSDTAATDGARTRALVVRAWQGWRQLPWELRAFRVQPIAYRAWIVLVLLLWPAMLAAAGRLGMFDDADGSTTTLVIAAALAVASSAAGGVFRISSSISSGVESTMTLVLVFADMPTEALVFAYLSCVLGTIQRPMPIHLMFLNISYETAYVASTWLTLGAMGFWSQDVPSIAWLGTSLVAIAVYMVAVVACLVPYAALGGYETPRESLRSLSEHGIELLRAHLPLILVTSSFVIEGAAPSVTLAAALPLLLALDAHRSREREVDARLEAVIDPLTGLANRRGLEQLWHNIERGTLPRGLSHWVMLADLDRFKQLNDTLGHAAGDDALVRAARVIKDSIRTEDRCARYGGEEFVFIVVASNKVDALGVAERVRTAVERELLDYGTTISIGMRRIMPDTPLENAIEDADQALYRSKEDGRNRITRFESMSTSAA